MMNNRADNLPKGYMGKILTIDLTEKDFRQDPFAPGFIDRLFGGRGDCEARKRSQPDFGPIRLVASPVAIELIELRLYGVAELLQERSIKLRGKRFTFDRSGCSSKRRFVDQRIPEVEENCVGPRHRRLRPAA